MKKLFVSILLAISLPAMAQGVSKIRDCKVEDGNIAVRIEVSSYDGKQQIHIIRKTDIVSVRYLEMLGEYWVELETRNSGSEPLTYKFNATNSEMARKVFDDITSLTLLTKGKQK